MNKQNDVLLFSCGIDSLAAWFYMNKPRAIYINLMTKYTKNELDCLSKLYKLIPELIVGCSDSINLGQFEVGEKAFIPNRNLILASIANNFGDRIICAGIKDDNVGDKSEEAFKEMSYCLSFINNRYIEVYSPFWNMSKIDIISWMLKNVTNAEEIIRTSISCYTSGVGGEQCGKCPSCLRKAVAMSYLSLDISFFKNDITKYPLIEEYIQKMKDGKYDEVRSINSLEVFKKWGWLI